MTIILKIINTNNLKFDIDFTVIQILIKNYSQIFLGYGICVLYDHNVMDIITKFGFHLKMYGHFYLNNLFNLELQY